VRDARAEQPSEHRSAAGRSHETSTRQSNVRHKGYAASLSYDL
jgi:hypothetical protein